MNVRIRIPDRVFEYFSASQAAYTPEADPELAAVIAQLRATKPRKDKSRHIAITDPDQIEAILSYTDAMATGAKDNLGYNDEGRDALADLNAARAVLRAVSDWISRTTTYP